MAYTPHTWQANELVTPEKLNAIEIGLGNTVSNSGDNVISGSLKVTGLRTVQGSNASSAQLLFNDKSDSQLAEILVSENAHQMFFRIYATDHQNSSNDGKYRQYFFETTPTGLSSQETLKILSAKNVVNNLTSTSTTDVLSAAMGKQLNESKLSTNGGTLTGALTLSKGITIYATNDSGSYPLIKDNSDNLWIGANQGTDGNHHKGTTINGGRVYISTGLNSADEPNETIYAWIPGVGAKSILHNGNYNDYVPSKTGTGASGTWGINISGNSATASCVSAVLNYNYATDYQNLEQGVTIQGVRIYDSNNALRHQIYATLATDGRYYLYLATRHPTSSTAAVANAIGVGLDKDDNMLYYVAKPDAFRNAIGASSGLWPVSVGGTGRSGLAANQLLCGNGTGAVADLGSTGTSGQFLKSNGNAKPSWVTLSESLIPSLSANKITSGTFATARIPNLTRSKITDLKFNSISLPDSSGSSTIDKSGNETITVPNGRGIIFISRIQNNVREFGIYHIAGHTTTIHHNNGIPQGITVSKSSDTSDVSITLLNTYKTITHRITWILYT